MQRIIIYLLFLSLISCNGTKELVNTATTTPNVVLIVIDDLGWKDLGFMGSSYYETPNLDAFAKEGMVFNAAYASAANCAPSRACMLSGLQSPKHGVYTVSPSDRGNAKTRKIIPTKNTKHLDNDAFLLPDLFKSMGYTTGSFGKWHVGNDPLLQGIDVNVGGSGRGNPGKGGYFSPYKIDNITDGPDGEYLTDRLTQEAIEFMKTNSKKPFFLYMPYYTVHTPIMGKPDLIEKFKNKKGSNGQENATYAAMVAAMDQNVGQLLATLKQLQLEENTLVIFTSDNGGIRAISNQSPLRAGKGSYYEGGIRVPMVVRWPNKIKAGSTCDTRVTNLDFFPTLKNIIGATQKSDFLDGADISPLFKGNKIQERDLMWHFPIYLQAYNGRLDDGRDPLFRTRPGTAIISENWKLHEYFEDNALELYNLSTDIGERTNLVDIYPEKAKSLHQKMKDWRALMNAPVPSTPNPEYDAAFEKTKIAEKQHRRVTNEEMDYLGITNKAYLSAASKRALAWPKLGNEWFGEFKVFDLKGDLAYEEGVVRRDPSAIIQHDGKYFVWYSKSTGPSQGFGGDIENEKVFPWDRCDIWYATSTDGWTWKEEGMAVPRGKKGAYDDRSVFTTEILAHEGKYYLTYQTVKSPYNVRVKNQVGLAWADSPYGPWTKSTAPILSPADNGIWEGQEQNRFKVKKKGDFDSHKVHDPCLLAYKGKFYLYYKGEQMGEEITFGGRQIRHGVAIAENPLGPYVKSPYNPISNSGHEICVWHRDGGIAALITTDGPEKNTIQWAPDGINFEIKSVIKGAPHAIGLNRTLDTEVAEEPFQTFEWGLTHQYKTGDYQYIRRFEGKRKSIHVAKGVKGTSKN